MQYRYRADGAGNFVSLYKKTRSGGFGQEVKKRIMLGTYFLSSGYYDAYYLQSLKARTQIREELQKVFRDYDFIVTPTSPTVAFQVGEKGDDPLTMSLSDIYTIIANLAGVPAISIPCGFVGGMPVGLQVMGRPFEEGRIFQFCYALGACLGENQLPEAASKGVRCLVPLKLLSAWKFRLSSDKKQDVLFLPKQFRAKQIPISVRYASAFPVLFPFKRESPGSGAYGCPGFKL